ncbi:hypothetical protein BH160DRAFT_0583 [Burkholderia sp. H160]|nr:hypothetical protein BH160DRAFT_0583 [Burkholderia sp. H160]
MAAFSNAGMEAVLSTLKRELVEQGGDYEEVLHQRANEIRLMKEGALRCPTRLEA